MQTGYSVFIPFILFVKTNRGEWCGFMCCNAAATLWCYLVLSWFKFYCYHALIHHSSVAHKSHFGTGFYGYMTGFSA